MNLAQMIAGMEPKRALIIGLVIGVFYYAGPYDDGSVLEQQIQTAQQQISSKQAEIQRIDRVMEATKKLTTTKEELAATMEQVQRFIPRDFTSVQLMKIITTEAKTAGLNIVNVTEARYRGQGSAKTFIEEVPVSVRLEGSYAQIMSFLSYITRIDKVITLQDFRVNKRSLRGQDGDELAFDGAFTGYRYREEQGAGA